MSRCPLKILCDLGSSTETAVSVPVPEQGGTMLWKRIRHTVVFGGKIVKNKKEKD